MRKTHKLCTIVHPISFCFHFTLIPPVASNIQSAVFYFNFRSLAPFQYYSNPFLKLFVKVYVRHNGKQLNWLATPIKHYLNSMYLGAVPVCYTFPQDFNASWTPLLLFGPTYSSSLCLTTCGSQIAFLSKIFVLTFTSNLDTVKKKIYSVQFFHQESRQHILTLQFMAELAAKLIILILFYFSK